MSCMRVTGVAAQERVETIGSNKVAILQSRNSQDDQSRQPPHRSRAKVDWKLVLLVVVMKQHLGQKNRSKGSSVPCRFYRGPLEDPSWTHRMRHDIDIGIHESLTFTLWLHGSLVANIEAVLGNREKPGKVVASRLLTLISDPASAVGIGRGQSRPGSNAAGPETW